MSDIQAETIAFDAYWAEVAESDTLGNWVTVPDVCIDCAEWGIIHFQDESCASAIRNYWEE